MRGFISIFKREFNGYFTTPVAYVFIVIFLFFIGFLTFQRGFYELRQADLRLFFTNMPTLFIFLAPAMAMRLWAEERRSNSIELLFSLPVTTIQAVLGKFFAAWAVIGISLAMTFPMVITVEYLGAPDWGPILTGYLGSLLLSGAFLAIGGFFSGLSGNQVIAFVLAVVACAIFLYSGSPAALNYLASVFPGGFIDAFQSLSFEARFESMLRGVLELRDLAFFLLLGAGWLWATVVVVKAQRGER